MVTGEYLKISKIRNLDENRKELIRLYNLKKEKFYKIALKYTKSSEIARECVQESFKNAFKNIGKFRNQSALETWVIRILINVSLQRIKKERLNKQDIDTEDIKITSEVEDPFTYTYRKEIKEILFRALRKLKEIHRSVLIEHDLMGLSLIEISKKHNISIGTIKSRLFYGRKELKKELLSLNFKY